MRALALTLLALAMAAPVAAQTPPATLGDQYVPAPWWMHDPVIASVGYVRVELPSNRASFSANFTVVDRSAADATTKAADKVRALGDALRGLGADKVRIETTFSTRPLYEQYRDKEGNVQENQRADKIERYEVDAVVSIEIRDTALLEPTYAAVLSAKPTSIGGVGFDLEPENEVKTALYGEAVKDAARRARLAAEGAGGKLGGVKVIDPTGRACQTDVLAGWPSYAGGGAPLPTTIRREALAMAPQGTSVSEFVVTGSRIPHPGLTSVSPLTTAGSQDVKLEGLQNVEDLISNPAIRLPLQPPLRELTAQSCVVYGLG